MVWAIGHVVSPCWFESDTDQPILYDTKEEADKAVAEDWESDLAAQQEEVKSGDREEDEVDIEPEYWVTPCTVDENGCIYTVEDGLIYNPKTFVR